MKAVSKLVPHTLSCLLLIVAVAIQPSAGQATEYHRDCHSLSQPRHSPDYEGLPEYSIQRRDYTAGTPRALDLQISIPTDGFGGASIIRLACKLASDFSNESIVHALLFDDKSAARNLALYAGDHKNHGLYLWHVKGRYELDRAKKMQFVEFVEPTVDDELLSLRRVKIWLSID